MRDVSVRSPFDIGDRVWVVYSSLIEAAVLEALGESGESALVVYPATVEEIHIAITDGAVELAYFVRVVCNDRSEIAWLARRTDVFASREGAAAKRSLMLARRERHTTTANRAH